MKNNVRMGVFRNLSALLIKNEAGSASTADIDMDNDNIVDPNFYVVDGLDIIQSSTYAESSYARSIGYDVYDRPTSINRTHTYKSGCAWNPSDPNLADAMITPGAPNARIYWALSYQGSNEIIKISPDYISPQGTAFTELEEGKYCVRPIILYETGDLQADLSNVSTFDDIDSIIEGGGICGKLGPCTPVTAGPCDFGSFNIPDVTICKDECTTIDINSICEISSEEQFISTTRIGFWADV